MCWLIKLIGINYKIIYQKGKLNTNADALYRLELHTKWTFGINFNNKFQVVKTTNFGNQNNVNAKTILVSNSINILKII